MMKEFSIVVIQNHIQLFFKIHWLGNFLKNNFSVINSYLINNYNRHRSSYIELKTSSRSDMACDLVDNGNLIFFLYKNTKTKFFFK